MRKLIIAGTIAAMAMMMLSGCSDEAPQATLSSPNPTILTETILVEDVLYEDVLTENIITWDSSSNVQRWD